MAKKAKKEIKKEIEEVFEQVKILLTNIQNDNGVPRNIRKIAQESLENIQSVNDISNSPAVCASTCVSALEDVSQDLNCPLHTRTQIYQILALLEQIRDY
jgi:uncharacterized protein (UPF0147 family)